jgi:hypothetical protein
MLMNCLFAFTWIDVIEKVSALKFSEAFLDTTFLKQTASIRGG